MVEDVREQAVEAKLAAIESTNSKADAEGALEKCRKQEALNTIAFDDFKQTGMKLKDAIEDAVEASDALASTAESDAVYALRRKESDQASDAVALLRKLLKSKVAKARNANVAVAKTCALAEFLEMQAATARDEEEDAKADISEAKNVAQSKSDKEVISKASDKNDAMERILDAKSHTGMTGVSAETGVSETGAAETGASERGLGDVQMVPSIDKAHEQSEADEAESAAKKAQQNEKAQEKAEARKEQMKMNATNNIAQLESVNQRQTNASSTLDEELKGPDAEFVNKSVERIKEDAEAAAVERKLNGNVKKVELASEMSQDALMRNLVHSTKDALAADAALHRGPHNATIYSFNVPKSNCLTCKKHKETMRMSRGAAKASELAEAAGLTSRSIDHRMQVAKMQVELNARRAQTELDEAVASQIKRLEVRVNTSNDKADKALLLKDPAETKLADAELTEKEMRIAAAKAKVVFAEARGKYQVARSKEESQKAFLAKKEREWKEQIDAKKKRVAKDRDAVSGAQTSEEGKKSIKFQKRTEVLKFKNPFRIEHARAKVNASIAEGIVGEARQAVLEANKELSAVTAEFKSAQYHHSRWSEKLRKRFGYDENDIDGAPKALGVLSAYRGYEPTGATGIADLSPEDLAADDAQHFAKYSDSANWQRRTGLTAQQAAMLQLEQGRQQRNGRN